MGEMISHFEDKTFEKGVAQGVVLVDFYARWCGPCKMLAPLLERLAAEMEGKVVIAKVDIDQAPEMTMKYEITSVPTMILFKEGKAIKRINGLKDLETLKALVVAAS